MPTYTYRCKGCNDVTEVTHSMNEPTQTQCLKCNGEVNRVILPGVAIQFKGAGFYCNEGKTY